MKRLLLIPLLLFFVTGCSHITMLRTEEIQEINDDVRADLKKDLRQTNLRLDSLRKANSLLEEKLSAQEQLLNRMKADLSILATRMADESVRNDTRQEEISYRLDLLLGKSDKILAKKVVVSGAPQAPISLDSIERQANLLLEMETMFNTARADFLRGEYKIAFDGFKQVFEQMKTGEMAEESLYWMALCLTEAGQIDKAKVILNRLNTDFPEGVKTCITLFKLAGIAASENDIASQKQYLQTLLEKKQCMETNEFLQGAEMLEEILNAETTTPVPVDSLVAKDSTAKAAEVKTADSLATPAIVSEEKPVETKAVAEIKTEEPAKETPVNTEAVKEEKK
jgi:TolA-binding protein